ncbi:MAG TPA: hypothetical protein VGN34_30295, partial [Ktedonobacteraceae bacterium]
MYDLNNFYGPNAGYVLELYERYLQDPASVDAPTQALFSTWFPAEVVQTAEQKPVQPGSPAVSASTLSATTGTVVRPNAFSE